jgi:hypothetical protein
MGGQYIKIGSTPSRIMGSDLSKKTYFTANFWSK